MRIIWFVTFVLVLSTVLHANARSAPKDEDGVVIGDQKTFLPCFTKTTDNNNNNNNDPSEQTFVRAAGPAAESPGSSAGLKDKKNFIYGGVGGFAGMGGYAGVVGGLPVIGGFGGLGKYGGIGGAGGIGPGLGGAGGASGLGGGIFPCHP